MTLLFLFIGGIIAGSIGFNLLMSGLPPTNRSASNDDFLYGDQRQMMYDRMLNDPNKYREHYLMNDRNCDMNDEF